MTTPPRPERPSPRPGRRATACVAPAGGASRGLLLAALLLAAPVGATPALAEPADGGMKPAAGIGGVWRTGAWTPLEIPPAGARAVRAWVEDADGQFVGSPLLRLEAGAPTFHAVVRPGRPGARLVVERFTDPADAAGETGVAAPLPGTGVASTTPLLLVHGDVPAAAAAARLIAGESVAMQVVELTGVPGAPSPRDFDGFDAAIVCGRAVAEMPPGAAEAIDGWVRRGGRLVFIAGGCAAEVAAAGGAAAAWLPGARPRAVPLRRFAAIESFARSGGLAERAPPDAATIARFEPPEPRVGVVELVEAGGVDLPVVVRRAHGFGTITWIGFDIDEPWCAEWPGCVRLLAALLGGRDEAVAADDEGRRPVPDLAGQLRTALDRFERPGGGAATAVPFEIVAALGAAYVLALYPLDWWLVRRSGRPWIAWLTLPAIAGAFTLTAWALGGWWGRDEPAACRICGVVDIDAASGFVRGTTWAAVRSPANALVDVTVAADPLFTAAAGREAALSWWADRGTGFAGLDAPVAHPSLAAADYRYGESLATLLDVPIAAASTRLFAARWTGLAQAVPATGTLAPDGRGLLRGMVVHHLPLTLEGCWLVHGGWLYDVGRMEPGVPFDPETGRGPRSLAAAITRRRAVGDRDRAERWDRTGVDVARILEVGGFHVAAGGRGYTALEGGELAAIDLSPLATAGAAILVGTVPGDGPAAAWRVEAGGTPLDRRCVADALVRIVLPLGRPGEAGP